MKKIDNNWVDDYNNSWYCDFYTEEQAIKNSTSLTNCSDCSDCRDCSYCSDCSGCSDCSYCSDCSGCSDCSYCSDCSDCSYCSYCSGCRDCSGCSGCSYYDINPLACPEEGSFIGWKQARHGLIVKLLITEDAKRSSARGRKCRCSKAQVLAIENKDGSISDVESIASDHDADFIYQVGKAVSVKNFDEDRRQECSTGIHFFITRREAVDYEF